MEHAPTTAATDTAITETLDRWILSRLNSTISQATECFLVYEYADALDATTQFFWADFCDNYLELIKKRVYNEDGSASATAQQSAVRTLYYVLDGILKLYAPFCPHVTEELYAHIYADDHATKGSIHAMGQWPKAEDYPLDEQSLRVGSVAHIILEAIRSEKSEAKKSIKYPVEKASIFTQRQYDISVHDLESTARDIEGAGNLSKLIWKHEQVNGMVSEGVTKPEITLAPEAGAA
jgi:valyl-tRNA synthetase